VTGSYKTGHEHYGIEADRTL